jgi:hypothetical protein
MPDGTASTKPELSFKDAACNYISLGWRVFPLAAGAHVPMGGSNGHNGATRDIKTVLGWWGPEGNMPHANVGIATGRLSGIWVLDVDNHGDESQNGFTTLQALIDANSALPDTTTAMSPRGGLHYYFKVPEDFDIVNKAGILGPGLDSRSSGGYIVAPPSIRADRGNIRYAWAPGKSPEEIEPADTPEWMLAILREKCRKESAGEHDAAAIVDTLQRLEDPAFKASMMNYAAKGLGFELENIREAAPGTGNDTLFRSAFKVGQLIGMGLLDEISTHQELLEAAMERDRPEHEARDVIDRAFTKGKNVPRALPNAKGESKKRPMMPLAEAQLVLTDVEAKLSFGNAQILYEDRSLMAFATLEEMKSPEFQGFKSKLGKYGISKRDVEKEVKDLRKGLESDAEAEKRIEKQKTVKDTKIHFLGKSGGMYYYLSSSQRELECLSKEGHKKLSLLALAPYKFWIAKFSKETKDETVVDWDRAADWLFRESDKVGIFDPVSVKGVGAFKDGDRIVVNLGNELLVDGIPVSFDNYESKRGIVYEQKKSVSVDLQNPLTTEEAKRIVKHICSLSFETRFSAMAVAGWTALASLSGAIEPRVHCYVNGATGTGKSFLQHGIVGSLNRNIVNESAGTTTAAAIRQSNGNSARPNIIDEFEGTNEKGRMRLEGLLELMRNSFDGHIDKKGSTSGAVTSYALGHMYFVTSIVDQTALAADKTRIVTANLSQFPTGETGKQIERDHIEIFGELWHKDRNDEKISARFLGRVFRNIPRTFATIAVFKRAIVDHIQKQRGVKVWANLLGAAYAFENDTVPTIEQARQYLVQAEFSDDVYAEAAEANEHTDLVADLLSRTVIYQTEHEGRFIDNRFRIKDLAIAVMSDSNELRLSKSEAGRSLEKCGLRMLEIKERDQDGVEKTKWRLAIANKHPELAKMLAHTRWKDGWNGVLKSHQFTIPGRHQHRIDGTAGKVTLLDAEALFREDLLEQRLKALNAADKQKEDKMLEKSMLSLTVISDCIDLVEIAEGTFKNYEEMTYAKRF